MENGAQRPSPKEFHLDPILQALNASGAYLPLPIASFAPAASGAAATGALARVPLDPFTGLPLVSPRTFFELVAARALFEWNLLTLAAIRGQSAAPLAFSTMSRAALQAVDGLLQGLDFAEAGGLADSARLYAGGTGASDGLLRKLIEYFSPEASASRVVGYGLGYLGYPAAADLSARAAARDALAPALAAGAGAGGSGAPGAIIFLISRTESLSLSLVDFYVETGRLPAYPEIGGGWFSLSSLELDYRSDTSFLAAYLPAGGTSGGYSPLDLYA